MHRTVTLFVLLLVAVLALTGCGAAATPAPAAPTEAPAEAPAAPAEAPAEAPAANGEPFKIAFVLPSSVTDLAWGQAMWDGLNAVQAEMGEENLQIAYSDGMFQVADAAAAIRDYASEGYDLIIAHGTQYGNSMFDVARDFPETSFAWGTATDTGVDKGLNNVFAYEALAQEGGYVNGVIAALMNQSGVMGVVGPVEAGDAKLYIDGFKYGAEQTKPGIKVNVSYTGSFGDTALASEAANTHIAAGADILTGSAQQVVGAITAAKDKGVKWFGTQSDQSSLAPDTVVATQVFDWRDTIKDMIALNKAGTYGGKAYALTLANGGLKIVYNPGVEVPAEIKAAADAAIQGIESGAIKPLP